MPRVPKYKQIIQFIKEKIANGEWPIGTKFRVSVHWPNISL